MASLTLSNAKSSRIFWKEIAFSNPLTFRRACGLVINFWLWQSTTRSKSSARKIFQPRTTPTTRKGIRVRVFGVFRGSPVFSAIPNLNEVEPQSPRLPRRGATLGTPSEIIFNLNEVVAKLLPNGPHLETRSHNLVEVGDFSLIVLPEVARQTGSLGLCAATSLRL